MSTETSSNCPMEKLFSNPQKLLGFTLIATIAISMIVTVCAFHNNSTHGSQALLTPPTPLELKGQEIYYQEGCHYCHTQNIRPLEAEVKRYVNAKKYGFAQIPNMNEYNFETPSMRGSTRIGPDLARIAGSSSDSKKQLERILKSKDTEISALYHDYAHLFKSDRDMIPVFLSWKVRMMMQSRTPFSDNYQKSIFTALENQTRGDALVAYLRSLGKKQMQFAGNYYK